MARKRASAVKLGAKHTARVSIHRALSDLVDSNLGKSPLSIAVKGGLKALASNVITKIK